VGPGGQRAGGSSGLRAAGRCHRAAGPDRCPCPAGAGRRCPGHPSRSAAVQGGHRSAAWPLRRRPGTALGKCQADAGRQPTRAPAARAGLGSRAGRQPARGWDSPWPEVAGRWRGRLLSGRRRVAGPASPARAAVRPGRRRRPGCRVGARRARWNVASAASSSAAACPGRDGGPAHGRGRAGRGQGRAACPGPNPDLAAEKTEQEEETYGRQPEAAGRAGRRVRPGGQGWSRAL
jgi:hypothetical protein